MFLWQRALVCDLPVVCVVVDVLSFCMALVFELYLHRSQYIHCLGIPMLAAKRLILSSLWFVPPIPARVPGSPHPQVMTQNFEGKRKRIMGKRSIVAYKRPNFKKAIVTFSSPQWTPKKTSSASS